MFEVVITSTTVQDLEVDPEAVGFADCDLPTENNPESRAYQKETPVIILKKFLFPYNQRDVDQLDHRHDTQKVLFDGRIYYAPIDPDHARVLDIGSGTGRWPIEFATIHPNAKVIGTNTRRVEHENLPPNCEFHNHDAEKPWDFSDKFDFVHIRNPMVFSDQKAVFRSALGALAPGGYVQILDPVLLIQSIDDSLRGTALDKWFNACVEAGEKVGRPKTNLPHYRTWMEEVGFEDVTEVVFYIPINDWAVGRKEKATGLMLKKSLMFLLSSSRQVLVEMLGWKDEDVDPLLKQAMQDIRSRDVHAYFPLYVLTGRKSMN